MRIIARLDIKGESVIKGIAFEGLRKIGDPNEMAIKYYAAGADELLMIDTVATLYGRRSVFEIISRACRGVFIPITVGGGIRSMGDVEQALACGADKVAINSEAIRRPEFISEVARRFGAQCCVISVEAKRRQNSWEAYIENGRNPTGRDVIAWCREARERGAGEILLTSVDRDGTRRGFELDLLRAVESSVDVPVVLSGGAGTIDHVMAAQAESSSVAVALASALHYNSFSIAALKHHVGDEQRAC
jgi:cyclase